MNYHIERGWKFDDEPEKQHGEVKRVIPEILLNQPSASEAAMTALNESFKLRELRAGLAAEGMPSVDSHVSPAVEQGAILKLEALSEYAKKWFLRETLRIEQFTDFLTEQRAEVERGTYPNVWEVIEAFEVTDRLVSDDVIRARQAFFEFTDELDATDTSSPAAKDEAIAQRIATRFFKETGYQVNKNSLLESLANDGKMNCAGRFKAVAATLEKIGFNPATQIFASETADHIRTILKTDEGQWLIDGKKVIPYVPESGTSEMPLNDYKRELLGLDPEHRVVHGGAVSKESFGRQKSWLGKIVDKFVTEEKHEISNTRRGNYDNLKSSDPDNLSRLAHLVPGPVLALMQSQLFVEANAVIERTAGGAAEATKALANWRGTKIAVGGGLAMAMYSACGPIIEKYSEAKSPDEAADMIHSDIADVQLALEAQLDSVTKTVELASKAIHDFGKKDDKKVEEKKTDKKSELTGSATDSSMEGETAEQLPLEKLVMTKEEMYLMFAEQQLIYSSVDLALQHDDAQSCIDKHQLLVIDVGQARVLSPTFFKYFLRQRSGKVMQAMVSGRFIDETASRAAWQSALNDLEKESLSADHVSSNFDLTINGDQISPPVSEADLDRGEEPGSVDWKYILGAVPQEYIVSQANQIAVKMGETDALKWQAHDYKAYDNDRGLYLDKLIDEENAVPIGFIEKLSTGESHPIFEESELDSRMHLFPGYKYRPVTIQEKDYLEYRKANNDYATNIIKNYTGPDFGIKQSAVPAGEVDLKMGNNNAGATGQIVVNKSF